MKKKIGTMALMLGLALSASAQIELMFHYYSDGEYSHYTVMDRTKKLYWMDDDDNTCFEITNYKKSGNTETFTLEAKEKGGMGRDRCAVTTTVDANGHTATIKYKEPVFFGGKKYDIRTTAEEPYEQERITRYFNQLAGYPADEGIVKGASVTPSVSNAPQNPGRQGPTEPGRQGQRHRQAGGGQGERTLQKEITAQESLSVTDSKRGSLLQEIPPYV